MPDYIIRHLMIRGRVQGVGYRAFVLHEAQRRGLDGWVRNRRDGAVEAVVAGPPDLVTQMIADCRRGPSYARVDSLDDVPAGPDMLALRPPGEVFVVLSTV